MIWGCRIPASAGHTAEGIVNRAAVMAVCRHLCLPAVFVVGIAGAEGGFCGIAHGRHVVAGVIGVLIAAAAAVIDTHQAAQEIVIQGVGLPNLMDGHTGRFPLLVVYIRIQFLFCASGLSLPGDAQAVLAVVLVTDVVPVCVVHFQEVPMLFRIFVAYHLGTGNGGAGGVAVAVVGKAILETVVADGR